MGWFLVDHKWQLGSWLSLTGGRGAAKISFPAMEKEHTPAGGLRRAFWRWWTSLLSEVSAAPGSSEPITVLRPCQHGKMTWSNQGQQDPVWTQHSLLWIKFIIVHGTWAVEALYLHFVVQAWNWMQILGAMWKCCLLEGRVKAQTCLPKKQRHSGCRAEANFSHCFYGRCTRRGDQAAHTTPPMWLWDPCDLLQEQRVHPPCTFMRDASYNAACIFYNCNTPWSWGGKHK